MVLQSIRERLTGILAIAVLGILVIPFAFVGVNSYFQSGTANLAAMVNDQEITFNDFNQSFLNYRRRMQQLMGPAYDAAAYDSPLARREHLDRMIDERLLAMAADQLGLDIDDARLAAEIAAIPAFQVEGEFNTDVYQARLLAQGLSVGQFEADMRRQMTLDQLPSGVSLSSFATDSELREMVALMRQTRSFEAIVVAADIEAADPGFAEEEVLNWYQANQDRFQTEEQVLVEYLELNAGDLLILEEPDEDLLRDRFEQQKGRFLTPERRLVSHVLIEVPPDADEASRETARQQAQDIAERARAGEDFAALAGEFSEDAGSAPLGGDLGWVEPGVMVEAFENAMYELSQESPISDPVQTGFGWHVIQLRDIRPATGQSFEEARITLANEFLEEQAEREFLALADRLVDVVYEDPTTLEAAALDQGLEIQVAGPFGRAGGDGIAANPAVIEAAFSDLVLVQGSVSDPVDLGPNHIVVLRLREHFPVRVRPLEEVREDVLLALREERALATAKAQADTLLAGLTAGTKMAELASAHGLEVQAVEAAPRGHDQPDPEVVNQVFRLQRPAEGGTVDAVVPAQGGYALVSLRDVSDGVLDQDQLIAAEQMRRQLANAHASSEAWAMVRQLREVADIQVFEENLGVSR